MRKVAAEEGLMGKDYPALVFLEPVGTSGFLGNDMEFSQAKDAFIVVSRYTTAGAEATNSLSGSLMEIAEMCSRDKNVLSYYPLKRRDGVETEMTVFERYASQSGYEGVTEKLEELISQAQGTAEKVSVTTWTDGIGHIK